MDCSILLNYDRFIGVGLYRRWSCLGNYKVYTGLVPWCAWIVMTYLATRPKWFTSRYNLGDMYKVHRALGMATVAVIAFHLYLYFGKATKSILGWWGGYVALTSFGIGTISGLAFLTPKLRKVTASGRNIGIWLHRFNLVALVAASVHIHGFKLSLKWYHSFQCLISSHMALLSTAST